MEHYDLPFSFVSSLCFVLVFSTFLLLYLLRVRPPFPWWPFPSTHCRREDSRPKSSHLCRHPQTAAAEQRAGNKHTKWPRKIKTSTFIPVRPREFSDGRKILFVYSFLYEFDANRGIVLHLKAILPIVNTVVRCRGRYNTWKLLTSSFPVLLKDYSLWTKWVLKCFIFGLDDINH